ncbi:MAG: MFS transporter [Candidatus Thorarchaeota archaeon]
MDEEYDKLKRNVTVMTIGNTAIVSVNSLWIMFMPYFFSDIGLDTVTIGVFYTIFAGASAASSFFGGRSADRFGRKSTMIGGYAIYSTGPFVILISLLFARQSLILAIAVSIVGYTTMMAARGFVRPAASMLLVESSQKQKKGRSYMIATRVIPSIPAAILVLIGSELYFSGTTLLTGYFSLALIIGFEGLIAVVAVFGILLQESLLSIPSDAHPKSHTNTWKMHTGFFLIMVVTFSLDALSSSGLSWYVSIAVRSIDEKLYGYMTSISTLIIAIAALGAGEVVDRLGTKAALAVGWGLLALTVGIFPLFHDPLWVLVLYAIWTGLDMMDVSIPPLVFEERYPKEARATALGTFSTAVELGSIIGPALMSFTLLFGDAMPFFMKAVMNLIGVFLFMYGIRKLGNVTADTSQESPAESWRSSD